MKNMKFDKNGLIPAVIQDFHNGMVRMLGYMNREAIVETAKTGYVHFYSRSKERLWMKGETSGNFLKVKKILHDCDKDALLILVEPNGPTCHNGTDSCFGNEAWKSEVDFLSKLEEIIHQRWNEDFKKDSYTQKLKQRGVSYMARKVGEEAVETMVEAMNGNKHRFLEESADLIYHLMVLMRHMECKWEDVLNVLKSK
jgi:phosphoribosyl-ATP pyrophosphohydrolase/phosphoribosyl-AMP cyclohydrolase